MNFVSKTYGKCNFPPRVRDWKGYGIVQQCGTCEPLQSPTDVALEMSGSAELCRERPNNNSRTKYYDDIHTTDKDARHPEELVPRHTKKGAKLCITKTMKTSTQEPMHTM